MTINNELLKIVPEFKNKKYEVILVTGNNYYDKYKDICVPSNVKIVPFLNNMLNVLKCVDLIKNKFFDILYVGKIIQIVRENNITNLTRDSYHLSLDTGRFIASLYIYKNLINKNIDNVKYYPTSISNDEFIKIKELIKDN